MIRRAAAPAHAPETEVTDQIVRRIRAAVGPWRLVLFGSRARGDPRDDSDYDIYIEVDADRALLKEIDGQIRDLFSGSGWNLDFKVRARGTIEQRRDDPGTIEWDVAREGRVLYADPAASTLLLAPGRVREQGPEPPESVTEWLETAERDLRHAHDLWALDKGYWPEICSLSQQTSEKHMKALLVARHVRPKRTHDLSELLDQLRAAGCELQDLDADCELLTKHAVAPRYPAGLNLGDDDARTAFAAAERLVAAVRALLPPRLH